MKSVTSLPEIQLLHPNRWTEYALLDSGNFEKLERFGRWVLCRPEPQAVWKRSLPEKEWRRQMHARFIQEGSASGVWEKKDPDMPDQWQISYPLGKSQIRFRLGLTGFKHVGIFPEQAANWDFIYDSCRRIPQARVLNLFAYTGGASLAARAAGADVIHCDSIRQVVNWASVNMELSGQKDIRWLVEDAFKFVKREASRGRTYHGIMLDPPAWGHGPNGEKWKLEDMIDELISLVARILDPEKHFLVLNAYSLGYSPLILGSLLQTHFPAALLPRTQLGELVLTESTGRRLPAGVFARFCTA